jgi:hypothetical protein
MKIIQTAEGPVRAYNTYTARQRAITNIRRWAEGVGFSHTLFIHGRHGDLFTIQIILR